MLLPVDAEELVLGYVLELALPDAKAVLDARVVLRLAVSLVVLAVSPVVDVMALVLEVVPAPVMGVDPVADQGVVADAKVLVHPDAEVDVLAVAKAPALVPADQAALLVVIRTAKPVVVQDVNPGVMDVLVVAVQHAIPGVGVNAVVAEDALVNVNPAQDVNPIVVPVVEIVVAVNHVQDAWVDVDKLAKTLVLVVVVRNALVVILPANPGVKVVLVAAMVLVEDAKPLVLVVVVLDAPEDALAPALEGAGRVAVEDATPLALGVMALVLETVIPPAQTLALQDALPLVRTLVLGTVPVHAVPTVKPLVKTPVVPPAVLLVIPIVKVLASGKHPILYNLFSPVCFYLTSENFNFSKGAYIL